MKQIKLFFGILLLSFSTKAQTVLLNVDRNNEQKITERGPNLKKFTHIIFHAGLLASQDKPGAQIIYGGSLNLALGIRKKYKITPFYSLGFDIQNQYTDYKLKQVKGKILPDTVINNISGRLDYYSSGFGFYNRINFDPRRGNFLGAFLDLGIMGEWYYSIKSVSKNKRTDGTILKSVVRNLPYVNNLDAKIYARIGFSHFSLFGSYRLTELFKTSFNYPDLPRLILGMELAIF